jgi:pimeloyl-ACP methyl ester carboxylesterase
METVTSKDGTRIAFERTGEGPPVVVVGGALNDRAAAFPLADELSSRFTVIAYDRRGRGDSSDTPPYAVEREAEDLAALIDAANGSAFAVGYSSGAALILESSLRGVAITRQALYEPPYIVDASRPPLPEDYVAHLDELVASDRRGDAVEYFMTVGIGLPTEMVAPMRSAPMWKSLEDLAHTISYDGRVMGDQMSGGPLPREWSSVAVPTLVMDGGASPPWIRNAATALAAILPEAELRTLEGQTHEVAPDVLAPVLVEFFGSARDAEGA